MLMKNADDKSKRIALLQDLQHSPKLDQRQKTWLREELSRLRKGIQGEKDSAYFLDQYFKGGENHVVLHDVRLVFEGDVAQIDHLVINRGVGMYLLETKNYGANVTINAHGEFTAEYADGERFGIPSPIEQSRRHARILQRLLERLGIKNRTGGPLECYHVVMFHPKAIITRPAQAVFDTTNVIKADQFPTWHQQFVDKEFGVVKLLQVAANVRSLDTIREWGEKLVRQHHPANQLELPDFMQARDLPPPSAEPLERYPASVPAAAPTASALPSSTEARAKRLICLHCHEKISFAEGKFCWNNETRFRGGQYCRAHQSLF
jgi:hypothetical protein